MEETARPAVFVPNNDALILSESLHMGVAGVADGEYVGRQLAELAVLVQLYLLGRIDRQDLIGIDGDEDRAGIRLQKEHIIHVYTCTCMYVSHARVIQPSNSFVRTCII